MKPPADIADIAAKEDLRDELIRRVSTGELSPSEANARATELNLRPFVRQPELSDWLPQDRVSWTPLMTLAWIVHRSEHQVREHCDAWRAARVLWRPNNHGGHQLSSQRPAFFVESCSIEEHSDAECKLNAACLAGKLKASGVTSGVRVEIPAVEWHGAETWARGDAHDSFSPLSTETPSYEQVRFQAADVMRTWSAKEKKPTVASVAWDETAVFRILRTGMQDGTLLRKKDLVFRSLREGKFPALAKRAFDRSWKVAVNATGKEEYSDRGRRPGAGKRKSKDAKPAKT